MSKFSDSFQSQLLENALSSTETVVETTDSDRNASTCVAKRPNHLEAELGLREKNAIECFAANPCEWTLRHIPKCDQTSEMVRIAVEPDGIAIKSVSKKLITYELCKAAVAQDGMAIRYVPEQMLTDEIVQLAVENNGLVLRCIKGRITKKLAMLAVRQSIKLRRNDLHDCLCT